MMPDRYADVPERFHSVAMGHDIDELTDAQRTELAQWLADRLPGRHVMPGVQLSPRPDIVVMRLVSSVGVRP